MALESLLIVLFFLQGSIFLYSAIGIGLSFYHIVTDDFSLRKSVVHFLPHPVNVVIPNKGSLHGTTELIIVPGFILISIEFCSKFSETAAT